jgi:multiple sugar transport system permease protein
VTAPFSNLLRIIGAVLIGLLLALPLWWVASGSVKATAEIISRHPTFFPRSFTLEHFRRLLQTSSFLHFMFNSAVVAVLTTIITVAIAVLAGFGFFRLRFPGHETVYRMILLAYAFPSTVVLIPLYGMMSHAGLVDSPASLVIVNVAMALPFAIWMMRSFLGEIPVEIEEAALVDGASRLATLFLILLPIIAPGVASVAIFAFVSSWTEYLFASVLILSDANRTLPVGLAGIIGQYQIDWGMLLAGATLSTLPVAAMFGLIGRHFVAGLTEGAIK